MKGTIVALFIARTPGAPMASLSAAHLVPGKGIEGDRFYDAGSASDEGISKERAHLALWLKEIAPSNELRAWFGHDPDKFVEFRQRYEAELATGAAHEALSRLRELARNGPLTLVFAARRRTCECTRVTAPS